jgi:GT2 family glycosyltransferase
MPLPDVTVVIPVHGPAPYLADALASVRSDAPASVILVENGTRELDPSAYDGVRVLHLDAADRSSARNAGVDAATTPYVAFLDEDDVRIAGGLERQRAALAAEPASVMTYGRVIVGDDTLEPIADWNDVLAPRFDELVARSTTFDAGGELGGPLYLSATMVRRDAFLAEGGFDRAFDAHEDLDFYLRLARHGKLVPTLGEPVTRYRVHGANTPSDALYRGTLGVTAKHLPDATGRGRRALLERRVDALWSLGDFSAARREAVRAALAEPALLRHARFVKRLLALLVPTRLLAARR